MTEDQKTRQESIDRLFTEISCGNPAARQFCWAAYRWLHVVDDLFDRDYEVPVAHVALSLIEFTESVAANPFFQENRNFLLGVFRCGVLQWSQSEEWRTRADPREKIAAEVIKSGYQELFWAVAGLCGGIVFQNEISTKHREYDWT